MTICFPARRLRRGGRDHLVELAFDLGLEVGLDLIDLGELGERPAAIGAEMVHARHPVGVHRGFLLLRVLAPVALDLDDEMQQVIGAVAVIHQHDEVGPILPHLGAVAVRHFQAEIVVLGVGDHLGMRLGHAAELGLPVAVEHDPVDVVLRRRTARLPAVGARRVEADVPGGAGGVVGIEQRLDGTLAEELPGDGRGDAVAGHVGQFLIHEQRRIGARPCRRGRCRAIAW